MSRAATFPDLGMIMRNMAMSFSKAAPQSKRGGREICRRAWGWMSLGLVLGLGGCETGAVRVIDTSRTFKTVVIDAGHGGSDSGTRSRWGGQEKNCTLKVAQTLDARLRAAGFRTVMTRQSDQFVELNERAKISNRQRNAVFVSIHFNEARSRKVRGTEVYYKSAPSSRLAQGILRQIDALPGATSRGVKTANFRVLKRNRYPAVLVECGFLSSPAEGGRCGSGGYQAQLAGAIAAGIIEQRGGSASAP